MSLKRLAILITLGAIGVFLITTGTKKPNEQVVQIGTNGFTPRDFQIKVGGTVTFENIDKVLHDVNSADHPNHKLLPILNIGILKPGEKKSVVFTNPGKYSYHDHLNPTFTGSFVVVLSE